MDNTAFTAGVVPGGLTTHKEIKVLVLYLLSKCQNAVPRFLLLEALSFEGIANYFECADAVSDLQDLNHIIPTEAGFIISDTGKEIALVLENDLPLSVREKSLAALERYLISQRNRNQHHVEITAKENGYIVRCSIKDFGSDIFAIEVYSPTKSHANLIRENFVNNGENIMLNTMQILIPNL